MAKLQPPDALSTILIWVGAIFMALKGGVEAWPAASRTLHFVIDWGWLNFVPLALLTAAATRQLAIPQQMQPTELKAANELTQDLVEAMAGLEKSRPIEQEASAAPPPTKERPPPNPAITTGFLDGLVAGKTALEIKGLLGRYKDQRAKIVACVEDIEDDFWEKDIRVVVSGITADPKIRHRTKPFGFPKEQSHVLEPIRPGDWIELTGDVAYNGTYGWVLRDCEFLGRSSDPWPPASKPQAQAKRKAAKKEEDQAS